MDWKRVLPLLVAILVAGSVGYYLGSQIEHQANETPETIASLESPKPVHTSEERNTAEASESSENSSLTLDQILEEKEGPERSYLFGRYVDNLELSEIPEALEKIESMKSSPRKVRFTSLLIRRWGELAGQEAFQFAMSQKGRNGMSYLSYAIEGWAKKDPVEAWDSFMNVTNSGAKYTPRIGAVLGSIARENLELAVAFAQDLKDPRMQQSSFQSIVVAASEKGEYKPLLAQVLSIENLKQQQNLVEALFTNWGQYESNLPFDALESIQDDSISESAMRGFIKGWATNDGQGALEYTLENASDPLMKKLSLNAVAQWARYSSAEEMKDIMQTIASAENSKELTESIIQPLAQADPEGAIQWVANIEDLDSKATNTAYVLYNWARTDPESAKAYYRKVPEEKVRITSTYAMTYNAIHNGDSPNETIDLLTRYEDPKMQTQALEIMTYAATQPRNRDKSQALRNSLLEYAENTEILTEEKRGSIVRKLKPKE